MPLRHFIHSDARHQRLGHDPALRQRRFAACAAKSSTNPIASILRSRWTPNDTSRANLCAGQIAPYRFSRKVREG